jgi:hypothetical protein
MLESMPDTAQLAMQVHCSSSLRGQLLTVRYSAQRNLDQSTLLRLPAEIRNNIWSIVVGRATVEGRTRTPGQRRSIPHVNAVPDLRLPLVCRQIYAETVLLPFEQWLFYFITDDAMDVWAAALSDMERQSITLLKTPEFCAFDVPLHQFSGLKTLFVCTCRMPTPHGSWDDWVRFYRETKDCEALDIKRTNFRCTGHLSCGNLS